MGEGNLPLLGRLKRAVRRLKFLLALWRMPSNSNIAAGAISKQSGRRGLESNREYQIRDYRGRTSHAYSNWENDDIDVDKRAENFIANFRRQLRLERQASLESSSSKRHSFEDDQI